MSAALDKTFAALAHGPRRDIVAQLAGGSSTISELGRAFPFSKQAMTKHVAALESAGLVRRTIRGRSHHLSLVREPLDDVQQWIDDRKAVWEANFDRLGAVLAEDDA